MRDYSSFGLKEKVAIVTGPSKGIGRAIALGLAQAGAHLALAKHPGGSMEEIQQVRSEIELMGLDSIVVPTDVSQPAQLSALMETVKARFGKIDILVNNAGWTGTTPAEFRRSSSDPPDPPDSRNAGRSPPAATHPSAGSRRIPSGA